MDIINFVPELAKAIGVAPSVLLFWIIVLTKGANIVARAIPNDATGALGVARKVTAFIGLHVSSKVTSGVTLEQVATAALATPPITQKAEAIADGAGLAPAGAKLVTDKLDDGIDKLGGAAQSAIDRLPINR